jgi:hypothetical protein
MKRTVAECVLCFVVLPGLASLSILVGVAIVSQLIVKG